MKLAIVGAGWVAENGYLPHLRNSRVLEVVSVWDTDIGRASALASNFPNARGHAALEPALEGVDAILLSHPSPMHVRDSVYGLERGLAVLCEKPIASRRTDVARLRAAAEAGGGRFIPASVCRFREDVSHWKKAIARIGKVESLRLVWKRHRGIPGAEWHLRRGDGMTGVVADLGHHLLDLAAWVLGTDHEVRLLEARFPAVHAIGAAAWYGDPKIQDCDVPLAAELSIDWGGKAVQVEVGWIDEEPGDITRLEAVAEGGRVYLQGLFGFSPERRIAAQTVSCEAGKDTDSVSFQPGGGLHREAFRFVLEDLARAIDFRTDWDAIAKIAGLLEDVEAVFRSGWQSVSGLSGTGRRSQPPMPVGEEAG